jgi:hypothetical protein
MACAVEVQDVQESAGVVFGGGGLSADLKRALLISGVPVLVALVVVFFVLVGVPVLFEHLLNLIVKGQP